MLILISALIILLFLAYYFKSTRPQAVIEKMEQTADSILSHHRTVTNFAFGKKEEDEELRMVRLWYAQLKERYKYDEKKLLQLARDWMDYALATEQHSTGVYLWIEEQDEESAEEKNKKLEENFLRLQEIENRFAESVDAQNELAAFRKKKREQPRPTLKEIIEESKN